MPKDKPHPMLHGHLSEHHMTGMGKKEKEGTLKKTMPKKKMMKKKMKAK